MLSNLEIIGWKNFEDSQNWSPIWLSEESFENPAINRKKCYMHKQTLKRAKLQEIMLLNPYEVQKIIVFVKSTILSLHLSLRVQEL